MPIEATVNQPLSPGGVPVEAVAMSLCETRSALEGVLAAVNAMVRLQEEMLEGLESIEEAIRAGTAKADEGIVEAQNTRAEIVTARDKMNDHTAELKKQRETDNGSKGS